MLSQPAKRSSLMTVPQVAINLGACPVRVWERAHRTSRRGPHADGSPCPSFLGLMLRGRPVARLRR